MAERQEPYRKFHREYSYFRDQWEAFDSNFNRCNLSPGFAALDVGCGSGAYSSERLAKYGGHVVAIDIDPKSIDQAKARLQPNPGADHAADAACSRIEFRVHNAESMEFASCNFDLVVSRGGLRHCTNWQRAFRECVRVLKPHGFLITVELLLPAALRPLWKAIDNEQSRDEHYWEFPALMSTIQTDTVEVVQMIHEKATRSVDGFLEPIQDSREKRSFRGLILAQSEDVRRAINLREELSASGQRDVVFDYHLLNVLLTRVEQEQTEVTTL